MPSTSAPAPTTDSPPVAARLAARYERRRPAVDERRRHRRPVEPAVGVGRPPQTLPEARRLRREAGDRAPRQQRRRPGAAGPRSTDAAAGHEEPHPLAVPAVEQRGERRVGPGVAVDDHAPGRRSRPAGARARRRCRAPSGSSIDRWTRPREVGLEHASRPWWTLTATTRPATASTRSRAWSTSGRSPTGHSGFGRTPRQGPQPGAGPGGEDDPGQVDPTAPRPAMITPCSRVDGHRRTQGLVGQHIGWSEPHRGHPAADRHVRRGHRRPPVDPRRSGAGGRRARSAPPSPTATSPSSLLPYFLPRMWEVEGFSMGSTTAPRRCGSPRRCRSAPRCAAGPTVDAVDDIAGGVQVLLTGTIEVVDAPKPSCVAQVVYRYYI